MIVKVQRPLIGTPCTRGMPSIMIYDQNHEHEAVVFRETLPDWLDRELDNCPKVFAEAAWSERWERWRFSRSAEWQPW